MILQKFLAYVKRLLSLARSPRQGVNVDYVLDTNLSAGRLVVGWEILPNGR